MAKDYYALLGVSKNASADEIKRAFRKLANEYHPDRQGGNAGKFKEVNEAYQALSDPEKRRQYDQFGTTFEQAQSQGGGFNGGFQDFSGFGQGLNMEDLGEMLGGFGDLFGGGRGRTQKRQRRGRDLETAIKLSFREAVFGVKKSVTLSTLIACNHCTGSGAEPGSKTNSCGTCNGRGQVEQVRSTFFGQFRSVGVCSTCEGEGKTIGQKCTHCRGSGTEKGERAITVNVPAGIEDGQTIRLGGGGEASGKGSQAGDLYVTVQVAHDPLFTREGDDLKTTVSIPYSQLALGATIDVTTADGNVDLKIPAGTPAGQVFRLRGKGVPHLDRGGRGDLLVTITLETPEHLNDRQKKLIEELKKEGL